MDDITFISNDFRNNSALSGSGGSIYVTNQIDSDSRLEFMGNQFINCSCIK